MSGNDSSTNLTWSQEFGKRVRTGSWQEQAVSTTGQIQAAIRSGNWETAAQLLDYWMEEAKVVYVVYRTWTDGWRSYLAERGLLSTDVESEIRRLQSLLRFPDGRSFDSPAHWAELSEKAGSLTHRMRSLDLSEPEALAQLDELRESWRQHHDRGADFQSGLLTYVARQFGETSLGEAFEHVLSPYLAERYAPFDVRLQPYEESLDRNIYLAFEAMRGHLVGSDRLGDIDIEEDSEKIVLSFDPCGSGNRGQRGDPIEGTGSRSESPYDFGVTSEEHDWAWNERGVCYYCAHCCYALEYWPTRQWGHPLRVVDSPLHPDETSGPRPKKCTWTIYKSIDAIPQQAYRRVGTTKQVD
jgi:hypothetical protein